MIEHAPKKRTSRSDFPNSPGFAAWLLFSIAIPGAIFAFVTFLASSAFAQAVGQSKDAATPDVFQARAAEHTARTKGSPLAPAEDLAYAQAWSTARSEVAPPPVVMAPTRSSFPANWNIIGGATGYRLDVSTSRSFESYVSGYQNLDVGDMTSRVVSGLSPGTTYYYRVRAYDPGGNLSASDIMTTATTSSSGLVIVPTFDASILNNANSAAIQAMINQAIAIYQSVFSDPITVNIRFRYSSTLPDGTPMGTSLARSDFVTYPIPWNTYISALTGDAKTGDDATANASLPVSPLSTNVVPSSAGGRAIGLATLPAMFADGTVSPGGPYDGIVTLNSIQPFQFNRPPAASKFDALSATEHEIDEVLGLGTHLQAPPGDRRPQDLFSWGAPATRNISSTGSRYFSIDGGNTNIVGFNQDSDGDFGDWLSDTCPQANPYVQNAFGCPGQFSDVTATSPEGINLDVIGYDNLMGAYTISTSSMPSNGGTTSGGGTFPAGTSHTVTAMPSPGYTFTSWTENGSVVSTSASYTFPLNSHRNLVAVFTSPCPATITQSSSQAITLHNSVSCGTGPPTSYHYDTSYWRAFNMAAVNGSQQYNVTSVSFGIDVANDGAGQGQPLTVRLYTNNGGTFPGGNRTQIATTSIAVMDQTQTILNVPLTASVPAGTSELIMEVFTPSGVAARNSFFIGSNTAAQTGPSYASSEVCGNPSPTDTADIGRPDMHIVFNIQGNCNSGPSAQALNISTRLRVELADNAMIGGFIITGNDAKTVVLRGMGPSLANAGLSNVLADPVLELHGSNGAVILQNDNWRDTQEAQIQNSGFQPSDNREAVIIAALQPGAYTGILTGKDQTTGVGLVEFYDTSQAANAQLRNLSTRGLVQTANNVMIGGFILGGDTGGTRVAIRGIGPSLSQSGLSNVLANPTLELHDSNGTTLVSNDNWGDDAASAAALSANGLALQNSLESGIFTTLVPGAYTAILAGKNGGTGIGLVEVYNLQ
jgi:hypothetical protein